MSEVKETQHGIHLQRRSLLKMGATACAVVSAGGIGMSSLFSPHAASAQPPATPEKEEFIYTCCANNCGSTCILKCIVKDDKIVRIDTDNGVEDNWEKGIFQIRACPRGRAMRRQIYAPQRLKFPMKRRGKRGSGQFDVISWDEALDTIAAKLKATIEKHGNEAVLSVNASGVTTGSLTRREVFYRLMNTLGGFTLGLRDYSSAQNQVALTHLYGKAGYSGNAIADVAHTQLAVFFGANFIETRMSGGGLQYELLEAKKKSGTRIIVIDPRFSDTCITVADEWIPIRPGTDAALASALAYLLLQENLVDKEFLASHSIGFDAASMPEDAPKNASYTDYILGTGYDKKPKTPEWAAAITGIPAYRITQLAREIGNAKPCFITQGWGLQRQANGEMNTMAIAALATLTGNFGVRGGGNGDYDSYFPSPLPRIPVGTNPVQAKIPVFMWVKAIEDGKNMTALADGVVGAETFPTDVKFMWCYAGNHLMNQHSDINHTKRVLSDETKCEMIVVMDTHLTASAEWADIILPSCAYPEQRDLQGPSYSMNNDWVLVTGEVKPFFESRSIFDVCVALSKRLGVEEAFTEGLDRDGWIDRMYQNECRKYFTELPDTVEEARAHGIYRKEKSRLHPVPFESFRNDPEENPLNTPSGKIELYSSALQKISETWKLGTRLGDVIPPTPQYVATWDGYEDHETAKKYPLQMIGHHYKGRTHSHYAQVDWLLEVSPQTLWVNPLDAAARGISHGDVVSVVNDRGIVEIKVKVTKRIMPGVVSLPQGAWHKANAKGVDTGGCVNTLTLYHPSPIAKGNPQHTNRVEISKK